MYRLEDDKMRAGEVPPTGHCTLSFSEWWLLVKQNHKNNYLNLYTIIHTKNNKYFDSGSNMWLDDPNNRLRRKKRIIRVDSHRKKCPYSATNVCHSYKVHDSKVVNSQWKILVGLFCFGVIWIYLDMIVCMYRQLT